jgi:hypothetical protein
LSFRPGPAEATINSPYLTRRAFLTLSASGATLGAFPNSLLGAGFRIVRRGDSVHVLVGEQPRWVIDPASFGPRARIRVTHADSAVVIDLRRAFFPGTALVADFRCVFRRSFGAWTVEIVTKNGTTLRAEALPWLLGSQKAAGNMAATRLNVFDGFSLNLLRPARVDLSPDWELVIAGPMVARVDGVQAELPSSYCSIHLCTTTTLAAETGMPATSFLLERGDASWPVSLHRSSSEGWSLQHETSTNVFSVLQVEAGRGQQAALHSAIFIPDMEKEVAVLSFLPSPQLVGDSGDTFALPLLRPRLAFTLGTGNAASALVADIHAAPRWAHGRDASYLLSGEDAHGGMRQFEMIEDGSSGKATPSAHPGVHKLSFPQSDYSADLVMHRPRTIWPDLTAPFEWFWGKLGLMPSEHATPFPLLEQDEFHIDRPIDFLSLKFQFLNMQLHAGPFPCVEATGAGPARITVIFPPQNIGEEAVFHSDDSTGCSGGFPRPETGDYNSPSPAPPANSVDPTVSMRARLAGESRLVFTLPNDLKRVPLHLDALLDWSRWIPYVAQVAKKLPQPPAMTRDPSAPPMLTQADPSITRIEMPWRLHLSPNDLGRWSHSLIPVSHGGSAVELWHTRLGVAPAPTASGIKPKRLDIDDTSAFTTHLPAGRKAKEARLKRITLEGKAALRADESTATDRTVRAIWTDGFDKNAPVPLSYAAPAPGVPIDALDPFLMSLDHGDRTELVHLTTNYGMPDGMPTCDLQPQSIRQPLPVNVNRMMLTSLGGYLDVLGKWNPGKLDFAQQADGSLVCKDRPLEVQEWAHLATLGRDQYVRVVYKGYLLPFGHAASVIKITERRFAKRTGTNAYFATLHQRIFIVVQEPIRKYPTLGQSFAGRDIAFSQIEAVTLITPDLEMPADVFPGTAFHQNQDLFWPSVSATCAGGAPGTVIPFKFRFRFYDVDGSTPEADLPVMFAGAAVAQNFGGGVAGRYAVNDAITFYNAGSNTTNVDGDDDRTTAAFRDQRTAFAPAKSPNDTQYITRSISYAVKGVTPDSVPPGAPPPATLTPAICTQLYQNNLPYFFPAIKYMRVQSPTVQHIVGTDTPAKVSFYPDYLRYGFDPAKNAGEVFLKVQGTMPRLAFGGANAKVDQSGGLASPDIKIAGYSRKGGPVGGRDMGDPPQGQEHPALTSFSSGTFDPNQFFGGLTSARILGAVKLSDIIAPLVSGDSSNLGKAPQMLEQAVHDAVVAAETFSEPARAVIQKLQVPTIDDPLSTATPAPQIPNPLSTYLAPQAAAVDAAYAAVQACADPTGLEAGICEGQLIARILDYAKALESVLAQPQGLAEEFLADELNALLTTQIVPQITAAVNSLTDAALNQLSPVLSAAQQNLVALQTYLNNQTDLVEDDIWRLIYQTAHPQDPKFNPVMRKLNDVIPELAALLNLIPVGQDFAARVTALQSTPHVSLLTQVPAKLGNIGAAFNDAAIVYQQAGLLGLIGGNPNALFDAQDKTRAFLMSVPIAIADHTAAAYVTAAAALDNFNAVCLTLAGQCTGAEAAGRDVLKQLRTVQRCVGQIKDCSSLITRGGLSTKTSQRALGVMRTAQRDTLAALAALQTIAQTQPFPPGDATKAAAAVNAGAQAMAQQVTVIGKLVTKGNDYDLLLSALIAPGQPFAGPLGTTYADINSRVSDLRGRVAAATTDLGLQVSLFNTAFEADIPLAAAAQAQAFSVALASMQPVLAGLCNAMQTVDQVLNTVAGANAMMTQTGVAAVCTLNGVWKTFEDGLPPVLAAAMAHSLQVVDVAFAAVCPPGGAAPALNGPADLVIKVRAIVQAFVALVADVRQQVMLGSDTIKKIEAWARAQLPLLLQNLPVPTSVSVSYDWYPDIQNVDPIFSLDDEAEFVVTAKATLALNLADDSVRPTVNIQATLSNFTLNLIGNPSFLIVHVKSLQFTSINGRAPDCKLAIKNVEFGQDLGFVGELAALLDPADGPFLEITPQGIRAGYRFGIDAIPVGAFLLMQLSFDVAVALPFDGEPVRVQFSISDETYPFLLVEGIYAGGGYLMLELGLDGVQAVEGALEFGVAGDISIGPVVGSGYVVAGIYFRIAGDDARVCGFVHGHGHMDIFGLIQLTIDIYVGTCYDRGKVTGVARFTVNVSILFFSETFHMEAQYSFGGSGGDKHLAPLDVHASATTPDEEDTPTTFVTADVWKNYYNSFAV